VGDGGRNVGEIAAFDRWTLTDGVILEFGGRYARYDYLEDRGLLSPRLGFTLAPTSASRVSAVFSQRMVAPGAEEFLSPRVPGPWLPPERTFSALGRRPLTVERARSVDVLFEHEFDGAYVLGVRRFFQDVDNQLVTLFGLTMPGEPESVGHYYVANGGGVDAQGWGVRLATPFHQRVRAAVDYSLVRTQWAPAERGTFTAWRSAAAVRDVEELHDITTSVEANFAETATRVFVLYKMNSGFAHASTDGFRPAFDGRFDMQVNQALPFGVGGTKWEVLVGLRNLFRDPNDPASVFDELLVVRPPKRVVGGFLVRF
jgi:outer membrane receptor protein involved in Fe transport